MKLNFALKFEYFRFGENIVNELTLSQVRRTEQNTRLGKKIFKQNIEKGGVQFIGQGGHCNSAPK